MFYQEINLFKYRISLKYFSFAGLDKVVYHLRIGVLSSHLCSNNITRRETVIFVTMILSFILKITLDFTHF